MLSKVSTVNAEFAMIKSQSALLQAPMVILLVDDDPFFRSAIKRILQKEGFQVIEAGDGMEGYTLVKEIGASIGLLLTDVNMPGMDGIELVQLVTTLYANIACTAHDG